MDYLKDAQNNITPFSRPEQPPWPPVPGGTSLVIAGTGAETCPPGEADLLAFPEAAAAGDGPGFEDFWPRWWPYRPLPE
jgi:hypothetical protein